ncbi:PRC-barrel domain-containing protein [Kitasatospora sp. NPDC006697]|uniref:PRC-barrel domain-containing protein n=1 Tax=Kitasatospora sp. NPDC006697 TaxID=3364020 RepID=UPI0036D0039E
MRFTETTGHPVVSATEATTVGVVAGFVLDPTGGRVAALRLRKTSGVGNLLAWSRIHAVGPDAVIVRPDEAPPADDEEAAAALDTLADKHREPLGKRVLTELGEEAGTVTDLDFDPETGEVLTLYTTAGEVAGHRTIGLGGYALVIGAAPSG